MSCPIVFYMLRSLPSFPWITVPIHNCRHLQINAQSSVNVGYVKVELKSCLRARVLQKRYNTADNLPRATGHKNGTSIIPEICSLNAQLKQL